MTKPDPGAVRAGATVHMLRSTGGIFLRERLILQGAVYKPDASNRSSMMHDTKDARIRKDASHRAARYAGVHYTFVWKMRMSERESATTAPLPYSHRRTSPQMTTVHMIVGSLLVLGYLIVLVLNIRTAMGRPMLALQRPLSFGAATLLLVQIMLGFSLLGEGREMAAFHIVFALLAVLPVGAEHALSSKETDSRRAGRIAAIANFVTLALVLTAYMIGELNS